MLHIHLASLSEAAQITALAETHYEIDTCHNFNGSTGSMFSYIN